VTSDRLNAAKDELARWRVSQSPSSPSPFDAERERDEAIRRTQENHRGELLGELDQAVESLARSAPQFTADDLREHLGSLADSVDLRVVGGVLRRAANRGIIAAHGYAPSRYRHGSPLVVWRSRICDAA
jgi:hypothetical protein